MDVRTAVQGSHCCCLIFLPGMWADNGPGYGGQCCSAGHILTSKAVPSLYRYKHACVFCLYMHVLYRYTHVYTHVLMVMLSSVYIT